METSLRSEKSLPLLLEMKDRSGQIGAKATAYFDDFLFDTQNQKMRARIIDGALAYSGDKLVPNDDRQFENNGFTLTVRGTKLLGHMAPNLRLFC